ncbi:MAG TPA: hypothetical protein VKD21_18990 [Acidimicrobiales bacterium]|nr:hypothetical protein [Acidimicrobiales bacterium]
MHRARWGLGGFTHAVLVAIPIVIAVVVGCSSADDGDAASDTTDTTAVEDVVVDAADFKPLAEMTRVRGFFVDNVAGDLEATLAVANDPGGGAYPVGTVIQLIPQEAMVKRAPGFDPDSNDWEFFTLDVTAAGTTIVSRGGSEIVNRFNGTSCAGCHGAAEPQFDFVCEHDHGCAPLPVGDDVITAIQNADPRG